MRSRRSANEQVAEVARRRLELLSAELAEIRPGRVDTPIHRSAGGSGELLEPTGAGAPGGDPAGGPGRHAHRPVGRLTSVGGWAHDRLPPTLQGRVGLTSAHLAVLALVVAAALAVSVWWALQAGGRETSLPVVASSPSALAAVPTATGDPSATGGVPAASAAATPTGSIVVDVTGKVRRPGIATLPLGSRVVDALEAAGGARPGVRTGTLNLARVLADGEQIVVGVTGPPGVAASAAGAPVGGTAGAGGSTAGPLVNLNSATQADLELLPGVGPVTARSILTFRSENGAFTSVDELLEVSGIGDATLAEIAPFVTL
jgi:competence protein ComEA